MVLINLIFVISVLRIIGSKFEINPNSIRVSFFVFLKMTKKIVVRR